MKVYVSSTMQDLRECRSAVDRVLRQMGHDVIGMEHYVAESSTPLQKVKDDVRSADVYLVIVGWRYGHVPDDESNERKLSITEIEYETAVGSKPVVLAFLLDPEAPWPPRHLDALSPAGGEAVRRLRAELGGKYLAGVFSNPDQLASQVAAAIARQGLNQKMLERRLQMESVSDSMSIFRRGGSTDMTSAISSIRDMVARAGGGTVRAVRIDLGEGDEWWSTRLFLLAALTQTLTSVRQFVFARSDGSFAGMASPTAVRDGLSAAFPRLAGFDVDLRAGEGTRDVEREFARTVELWMRTVQPHELVIKVGVRMPLLAEWLGERLITRCVRIDPEHGLTMTQVHQIVDSLLPAVPVERRRPEPRDALSIDLMVVDRDAFALELARQWVSASLPRTPIV